MGNVARHGIYGGQRVRAENILLSTPHHRIEDIFRHMCAQYDGDDRRFSKIADRVAARQELPAPDTAFLLERAPLPLLMKLVELASLSAAAREKPIVKPLPMVLLPLSRWLEQSNYYETLELARGFLRRLPYEKVEVALDNIDLTQLDGPLGPLLRDISKARDGLTLIGPSVEEIVASTCGTEAGQNSDFQQCGPIVQKLEKKLATLRQSGIKRLRSTSCLGALKLVHEAGLWNTIVTRIDSYPTPMDLARELSTINRVAVQGSFVMVWTPGFRDTWQFTAGHSTAQQHNQPDQEPQFRDFQILRALAVGTLALTQVPYKRASSRYLSPAGVHFALACGANEFGFGAVDESTARSLKIQPYESLAESLTEIVPRGENAN
ncbi:MAG: hypothetical protein DCC75_05190 [Proteobacteria bacterium]|nr:MAG: hypothetical protein DCC75_05190 [Pseudomonadota bacterium]